MSENENIVIEIIQPEVEKEKMKKNEQGISTVWSDLNGLTCMYLSLRRAKEKNGIKTRTTNKSQ